MDNFHTTQDICRLFGVTPQTVKNWADNFSPQLSPTSQPGKGKKRFYSLDDMEVFALIHEYSQRGLNYDDAKVALQNGQRGTIPERVGELALAEPPTLILNLRNKIADLETELHRKTSEASEAQGQVKLLKEQVAEKDRQIRDLYRELAKLEANQDDE